MGEKVLLSIQNCWKANIATIWLTFNVTGLMSALHCVLPCWETPATVNKAAKSPAEREAIDESKCSAVSYRHAWQCLHSLWGTAQIYPKGMHTQASCDNLASLGNMWVSNVKNLTDLERGKRMWQRTERTPLFVFACCKRASEIAIRDLP